MFTDDIITRTQEKFNNFFEVKEKRPGVYQLFVPLYHADGDMMDIFIKEVTTNKIQIFDAGLTLMRLSYYYEIDTENKNKIFNRILSEAGINRDNDNLIIETDTESFYPALMQFAQTISKIMNMRLFKREVIHSLFFEQLDEFIMSKLQKYKPHKKYFPLPDNPEYEVDYCFNSRPRPIYLFGVNNTSNSRLATISCQKFLNEKLTFSSLIVYEDFEQIGSKDQSRLMAVADKLYPSFPEFQNNIESYFERIS
jgi:hypothetical protein